MKTECTRKKTIVNSIHTVTNGNKMINIMKKATFFLWIILCCHSQIQCSEPDSLFNCLLLRADSTFHKGNFVESMKLYQACHHINPIKKEVLCGLARTYAAIGQNDSAFLYLEKASEMDSAIYHVIDGLFVELLKLEQWAAFTDKQLAKYEIKFGKIPRREITLKLIDINIKDQAYYELIYLFPDSSRLKELKYKMISEALEDVDLLVQKYGWPKQSDVGWEFAQTLFMPILHCGNLKTMKKYWKIIRQSVKRKDCVAEQYAYLTDRIRLMEHKKQLYATQFNVDNQGNVSIAPLKCPHNLGKRREKIGLVPIDTNEYIQSYIRMVNP